MISFMNDKNGHRVFLNNTELCYYKVLLDCKTNVLKYIIYLRGGYEKQRLKEEREFAIKYLNKRSTTQSRWDSRKLKRNLQKELDKQNNLCYVEEHKRKM